MQCVGNGFESRMGLFKPVHVITQALDMDQRYGVVNGSAHTAGRAMATQLHHALFFRPLQERIVEGCIAQKESDIHARTVCMLDLVKK